MNKVKRKHCTVVSDTGVVDKASRILEIKGSTLCYSERDKMWKDIKSFGIVELLPRWRPGKKAIMEARIRVATLKSKNLLNDLENLVAKLKQFKKLIQNSAFMPSLKETILKSYFDKNYSIWVSNFKAFPEEYKDRCFWYDNIDHSLGNKTREKGLEARFYIDTLRWEFYPLERPKKQGCLAGAVAALGAGAASSVLASAMRNKMTKKEK